MNLRISISTFLLFFVFNSSAQYVDSGQDPSFIDWKQINTENFQVLFPSTFYEQANQLANNLEKVYEYASATLNHKPDPITIILHNYNSNANAMVLWAPKRSDFNTIPPQDVYPQFWLEQLAIHEFRHVVQIDKMKQGFTKVLYALLGQQATAGVFGAYVPFWLVEGDAVVAETALSKAGRGRLPSFEMPVRALLYNDKFYSYEKAYLGSYRDFVPDYYAMGYHLTAYGKIKFGSELWAKVLEDVARKPYNPVIFNRSLKKYTGMSKREFYRSAYCYLDSVWSIQNKGIISSDFEIINDTCREAYTNYIYPQFSGEKLVALKTGFNQIAEFIYLDSSGNEEHIFYPGFININKLSVENDLIAWTEYNYDIRWSNRIYSDIILYDLKTNKRKRLTRRRYLFAPEISPDGSVLVAVQATPDYNFSLVFFDLQTNKQIKEINFPENDFLITPTWNPTADKLAYISLNEFGKTLKTVDLNTGSVSELIAPTYQDISLPVFYKNYVVFHGTWSGVDELYAVDTVSKSIFKITNSKIGSFNPEVDVSTQSLAYNKFTIEGYNLVTTDLNEQEWIPLEIVEDNSIKLYDQFLLDEKLIDFGETPDSFYVAEPYSRLKNLFNFHSWTPLSVDAQSYSVLPSITLLSQNKLSTSFTTLSFTYDYNEQVGMLAGEYSYRGLFPVISLTGAVGNRSRRLESGERLLWNEKRTSLGLSVPLNLTSGKYIKFARPFIGYTIVDMDHISGATEISGTLHALTGAFSISRIRKQAFRAIRPIWGQTLNFGAKYSPFGTYLNTAQFHLQTLFYFPGIAKHHSWLLRGGYQENTIVVNEYNFANSIIPPRGFIGIAGQKLVSASVEYLFPFLYPDITIGPFAYIKRLYANAFFDYAIERSTGLNKYYKSVGVELVSDLHFFRHILPFRLGIRNIYLPDQNDFAFQLILDMTL